MRRIPWLAMAAGLGLAASACGGGASSASPDAAGDGAGGKDADAGAIDSGPPACPEIDAGAGAGDDLDAAAAAAAAIDEFGPNAAGAKMAASIGRVNIYEVTTPSRLERVDVYLRAGLDHTRVTIAVQEASSRTGVFRKLTDVQVELGTCQGWATTGALAIPLVVGRYYAIGFDPNQPVFPFVSADTDSVPVDGAFGRLIGSKTATSVSVPTLTWDKLTDKEYNRQRLVTSPRDPDPGVDPADGGSS